MVLMMEKECGGVLLNHAAVLYISTTPFRHSETIDDHEVDPAMPNLTHVYSGKFNDVINPSPQALMYFVRQGGIGFLVLKLSVD